MVWMLDDEMHWKRRAHPRRTGTFELNQKRFIPLSKMIVLCICQVTHFLGSVRKTKSDLQMGPLFWYYKALYYGWMFRKSSNENTDGEKRKCFSKMVEAERDATLLRWSLCIEIKFQETNQFAVTRDVKKDELGPPSSSSFAFGHPECSLLKFRKNTHSEKRGRPSENCLLSNRPSGHDSTNKKRLNISKVNFQLVLVYYMPSF